MLTAHALKEGLSEQGRVLSALLLREIRLRFGSKRIGYAWAVLEPALHIGVLFMLRSIVHSVAPQHIPLLLWLITGIISFFMFRGIVTRTAAAARTSMGILVLPPVKLMDIVWARAILEMATVGMIWIFFLSLYVAFFGPIHIYNPLRVLGCLCLLAFMGMGFGMVCMSIISVFPSAKPLIAGVLRILYFFSGVMFSVTRIPYEIHPYLTWNPLLHVMESLRAAFFENYYPVSWASDLGYASVCAIFLWVFGVLLVKRTYRIIMEG